MKRFAMAFALAVCLVAAVATPEVKAGGTGIAGRVWLENDTDFNLHVTADTQHGTVDLGWQGRGAGWLNGRVDDIIDDPESGPPTTHLHAVSEDGSRTWDQDVSGADDYIWGIQN